MTPTELVRRLGGRTGARLGLDPARGGDDTLGRWLVAACLLRGRPEVGERAYRALAGAGWADPQRLAGATHEAVAARLAQAGLPRPEATAAMLVRAGRTLAARYAGSLSRLEAESGDFADLALRLARLAPGIGAATVAGFLRELRDVWPAADEVPLSRAAHAAACHLGWIAEAEDLEGAPGALRARLARDADAPPLADFEAALHRLGSRACLRRRPARCPLGPACPLAG